MVYSKIRTIAWSSATATLFGMTLLAGSLTFLPGVSHAHCSTTAGGERCGRSHRHRKICAHWGYLYNHKTGLINKYKTCARYRYIIY